MKKLLQTLLLSPLFVLGACGGGGGGTPSSIGGNNTGHGCTIESVAGLGVNITCDGVTEFIPNGAKGDKGDTGDTGDKGDTGDQGDSGSNVFADALSIHTSKRKSVFRLSIYCEFDTNSDGVFGDSFTNDGLSVTYYKSHYGTGFLIPNNEVATNKHVASDDACDYTFSDGSKWEGQIYAIGLEGVNSTSDNLSGGYAYAMTRSYINLTSHSSYDLTKFSVPASLSTGRTAFEIDSTNDENVLTPTLSMSFPLGISDMITNIGEIVTDDVSVFSGYDIMTSNDTDGGSSGSPIIDITTGKVIGLVTAGFTGVSMNPSIVIHASRLNEF